MVTNSYKVRGLTLLETLVSLSLVALICSVLYPMLRNAAQLEHKILSSFNSHENRQRSEDIFRTLVQSSIIPNKSALELRFKGDHSKLSFLAIGTDAHEPVLVKLTIVPEKKTQHLSVHQYRFFEERFEGAELLHEWELFDKSIQLRFKYYGDQHETGNAKWEPNWLSEKPPLLVQLEIEDESRTTRRIEVATMSSSVYFCDFDPITRGCSE